MQCPPLLSVHLCGAGLYWNCLRTHMVQHSWNATCEEMGERLSLMPAVAKLISSRRPQLRGELKTKIKPLVKVMYGFKTGKNKKMILYNQKLTEDLKEGSAFAFKDQGQDGYLCLQVAMDPGMEFGSSEDKPHAYIDGVWFGRGRGLKAICKEAVGTVHFKLRGMSLAMGDNQGIAQVQVMVLVVFPEFGSEPMSNLN
ncbi:hypothetical protein B0H10DRAFT_1949414 [Mycena sp. CBHHK59/15]|nr:hypothetical protein B0H10DRAFT_1949414 [Mycena sp. CBHHK59/15]